MARSTLIRPPPLDQSKSEMENLLELTALPAIQPDLFTNTRELWKAPGARGIYGGTVIAQSLQAAFHTVDKPSASNGHTEFLPHSMHCYFLLAGNSEIPILYYVERVREGRSFATRTVQARQNGKCIFTTTISFAAVGSGGKSVLQHGTDMPLGVREKLSFILEKEQASRTSSGSNCEIEDQNAKAWPYISRRLGIDNNKSPLAQERRPQTWLCCKNKIQGGVRDQICALAYMSDSYFIGTVSRVHHLERFGYQVDSSSEFLRQLALEEMKEQEAMKAESAKKGGDARLNSPNTLDEQPRGRVGMLVSLDHVIYFHHPRETKADEWLFTEMESPWSGEGRGTVTQKIWNEGGRMLASCVQEGVVRLAPETDRPKL